MEASHLIEERERACDEGAIFAGNDTQVYAQSILNVCKCCVASSQAWRRRAIHLTNQRKSDPCTPHSGRLFTTRRDLNRVHNVLACSIVLFLTGPLFCFNRQVCRAHDSFGGDAHSLPRHAGSKRRMANGFGPGAKLAKVCLPMQRSPAAIANQGIPTARAASILFNLPSNVDRTGIGNVVEVYPAAALKIWGFSPLKLQRKARQDRA